MIFSLPTKSDLCHCPEIEEKLYSWIIEKWSADAVISGNSIRKQAILLYEEIKKYEPNKISFIASNGWMSNFLVQKYKKNIKL